MKQIELSIKNHYLNKIPLYHFGRDLRTVNWSILSQTIKNNINASFANNLINLLPTVNSTPKVVIYKRIPLYRRDSKLF